MMFDGNKKIGRFKLNEINIKIPLVIFLAIIMLQALIGVLSIKMLINIKAMQIIIAGILISVLISYPMEVLKNTVDTIRRSYNNGIDYERTINKIHNLAIQIKKEGLLSIQEDIEYEDDIFIRDAMILLNDYKDYSTIEDIMDFRWENADYFE